MWDMKLMLVLALAVSGCATAGPTCVGMVGTPDQVGACFKRREAWERRQQAANASYVQSSGAAMQQMGAGLQQAGKQPMHCTPDPLALQPGSLVCR